MMVDENKRMFVGMKISTKLQRDLDNCAGGAERYFKEDKPESLRIVTFGEDRIIGRFLRDGFPVTDIDGVSRNVRSMITLITSGHRIDEDAIRIYADSTIPIPPRLHYDATRM
jgi:hypothetical protein